MRTENEAAKDTFYYLTLCGILKKEKRQSQNTKVFGKEIRLVFTSGRGRKGGELEVCGQKVPTSTYKISKY